MIRDRYKRIPHTSPDTTRERNTNNQDCIKKRKQQQQTKKQKKNKKQKKKKQHKRKAKRSTLSQQMFTRMWDLIVSVPDHCLSFYLS